MNKCVIFLSILYFVSFILATEGKKKCESGDWYQCGDNCIGESNYCTCGNESWQGGNWNKGCCPSSPGSCIKHQNGNVNCSQGEAKKIGDKCPAIGQCLTSRSFETRILCSDGECLKKKYADQVCRGIPQCKNAGDQMEGLHCLSHKCGYDLLGGSDYQECPK